MQILDVLSILGALAWVPPIISLFIKISKRPKISIFSNKQLEVGYTSFGPILNVNLAFLGENKNVLVNKMELQLIHENNETQHFTWEWFEEIMLQTDSPGGPIPHRKNQQAIAIKIEKDQLVEKKIGFHQNNFKAEDNKLRKEVIENYLNILKNNQEISQLKITNPYNQLVDHYKNDFGWRIGVYTVVIKLYILEKKIPFEHKFKFQLDNIDVRALETNINLCMSLVEKDFVNSDKELKGNWVWRNPNQISIY